MDWGTIVNMFQPMLTFCILNGKDNQPPLLAKPALLKGLKQLADSMVSFCTVANNSRKLSAEA